MTVTVTNENEDGAVSLSSVRPQVELPLIATLTDPDGSVTNIGWEWHRSPNGSSNWAEITGVGSCPSVTCSYAPVTDDEDDFHFLRATVSYTYGDDTGKTAQKVSENPVQAKPIENRQPTFPSSETGARGVEENTGRGVNIGDPVRADDPDDDDLIYTLDGIDAVSFEIVESTGQLTTKAELDRERKSTYRVRVTSSDPSTLMARRNVTITVTDVNEPPVITGLAGVDYQENGTGEITRFAATDPEGDTITWTLAARDDQDDLQINNPGRLTFQTTPDYETPTDQGRDNTYHAAGRDLTTCASRPARPATTPMCCATEPRTPTLTRWHASKPRPTPSSS